MRDSSGRANSFCVLLQERHRLAKLRGLRRVQALLSHDCFFSLTRLRFSPGGIDGVFFRMGSSLVCVRTARAGRGREILPNSNIRVVPQVRD